MVVGYQIYCLCSHKPGKSPMAPICIIEADVDCRCTGTPPWWCPKIGVPSGYLT